MKQAICQLMSKLNCLYNKETNILCCQLLQKWGGDNVLKVYPNMEWSLVKPISQSLTW